jgi:hypothetical protein
MTLAAGCVSRHVREATGVVAAHVDSLEQDYSRYLQRLEADAGTRIDTLAQQRQSLARAELRLERTLEKSSHRGLHGTFLSDAAEQLAADRAVARRAVEERAALTGAQKPLDRAPLKQLKELSKQLSELAKAANFKQQLGFLVEYFQAVGKEVRELDAKAQEKQKESDAAKPKASE